MVRKSRPRPRRLAAAAVVAAALGLPAGGAGAQGAPPDLLPGGATALTETHGDWTLACQVVPDAGRVCRLSQQRFDGNRQRVLAIELVPSATGAGGNLALPFGLLLAPGITFTIDEGKEVPLPFRTCLPAGCIVPLSLDGPTVERMRKGNLMKITATAADDSSLMNLPISLRGLDGAFLRILDLSGQKKPPAR